LTGLADFIEKISSLEGAAGEGGRILKALEAAQAFAAREAAPHGAAPAEPEAAPGKPSAPGKPPAAGKPAAQGGPAAWECGAAALLLGLGMDADTIIAALILEGFQDRPLPEALFGQAAPAPLAAPAPGSASALFGQAPALARGARLIGALKTDAKTAR